MMCLKRVRWARLTLHRASYLANSTKESVTDATPAFLTMSTFRGGPGHVRDRRSPDWVSGQLAVQTDMQLLSAADVPLYAGTIRSGNSWMSRIVCLVTDTENARAPGRTRSACLEPRQRSSAMASGSCRSIAWLRGDASVKADH